MIVPGILFHISFLIRVCMFIVLKALAMSSTTVIVRAGGAIWLNPFATVLFYVCSAVTVECCVLYPCCMDVLVCLLLCKVECSSPVTLQTKRMDMGLYEVPLFMSLVDFGISFQHAREECESKRAYVF